MPPSQLNQVRGIVFDKDGTLFDFNAVWSVWCDRVVADLSGGSESLAAKLADLIGYNVKDKSFTSGSLIVSAAAHDTVAALATSLPGVSQDEVNTVCVKHLDKLPLFPVAGLNALLAALRGADKILGVATNDLESAAFAQLQQAGVDHYFDFVCGCDSGFGSKPESGMIHAFCDKTGLNPSQVAMVGDSLHDINAGQSAGAALNIGVLTGPATEDELEGEADIVVKDVTELIALL